MMVLLTMFPVEELAEIALPPGQLIKLSMTLAVPLIERISLYEDMPVSVENLLFSIIVVLPPSTPIDRYVIEENVHRLMEHCAQPYPKLTALNERLSKLQLSIIPVWRRQSKEIALPVMFDKLH
jgi:hypothetical protein